MAQWPRDTEADLIAFYGQPGPEVERQLVHVVPPFAMYYGNRRVKSLLFHRKAADALLVALNDAWDKCGRSQAKVDALGISKTAGTYNKRKISGSNRWSNHAFGGAIDINAEDNGFGKGHGTIPQVLIDAFDKVRFRWGGRYHGRTDPMHFEACDDGMVHPVGLLDEPVSAGVEFASWEGGDVHPSGCTFVDAPEEEEHEDESAVPASSQGRGFFGRMRNWVVGGASSIGFTGLGFLTDWQVAVAFFAFLFLFVASSVGFIIWFFGADAVRTWVKEQLL